jgi:F-type H+-transporting ATPase subunit b
MKKILLTLLVVVPGVLFANEHQDIPIDILERTVNFFIFVAIVYYLLADKLKIFFQDRTKSIQADLEKAQELIKESDKKLAAAKQEVENAKRIADEMVSSAHNDTQKIKAKIEEAVEQEISFVSKSFDAKAELEMKRMKKEVVRDVLNQLLSNDNIALSQEDLANIILKKVA